jgi:alpha-L-rhamnosidase
MEIRPEVVGDVTWAKANYQSPYGVISSSWKKRHGVFELSVNIPANTSAVVYLPAGPDDLFTTPTGTTMKNRTGNRFFKYINGKIQIFVGSGDYTFTATAPPAK